MDNAWLIWLIATALAYLVGSIPFGLLIGLARGVDIREHGSCNVGATNCGRVVGRGWGLLCFALDLLKGTAPVLLAGWWMQVLGRVDVPPAEAIGWLAVAIAAVLGHVFPVWLRFKGGKGVATGFGVVLGLWPVMTVPAIAAGVAWIAMAAWKRYVSLASVVAAATLPAALVVVGLARQWPLTQLWPFIVTAVLMGAVVIVRHRSNLVRLYQGDEPKFGRSSASQ